MIAEPIIFQNYASAEKEYIAELYKNSGTPAKQTTPPKVDDNKNKPTLKNHIVQEIEKAREEIKSTLAAAGSVDNKSSKVEQLEAKFNTMMDMMSQLNLRIQNIESSLKLSSGDKPAVAPAQDDDDDIDLFGSDDEEADEEAEKLKQERLKQYAEKKAKKQGPIAKSSIVLDVKPWDDETDMKEMEKLVRSVKEDGLVWGSSKLVPLAYGIKKLQICCVVEDDKVGTDFLEDSITAFEDFVQSVDIAAFNKV